jgi:hypothetical protein
VRATGGVPAARATTSLITRQQRPAQRPTTVVRVTAPIGEGEGVFARLTPKQIRQRIRRPGLS